MVAVGLGYKRYWVNDLEGFGYVWIWWMEDYWRIELEILLRDLPSLRKSRWEALWVAVAITKHKEILKSWSISWKKFVKISVVRLSIAEPAAQIQIYNPFYC